MKAGSQLSAPSVAIPPPRLILSGTTSAPSSTSVPSGKTERLSQAPGAPVPQIVSSWNSAKPKVKGNTT